MGMAIKNLNSFVDIKEGDGEVPNTPYGHELQYIRTASKLTNDYFDRLEEAANYGGDSKIEYPELYLAQQLKIVAQLIAGGLKSKVFVVRLGGFDTHDNQVESGSPETGRHAQLMEELSESVYAFEQDVIDSGLEERVLTMTYSEFGRIAKENGSRGTDHGMAAPHFLIGGNINGGINGGMPNLDALVNNDILYSLDYRSLYEFVLSNHFNIEKNTFSKYKSDQII